ncbi:hypothetical protein Pyn_32464 [Prunus yedoensis var. nudiflora]|uniref:Uncharacterized protein n=1 Tax=Prunus yedoensis var. nudiflora TaxID=2094558 RepID=A0A314ZNF5_PRUYE|nr:hypothetical protein Pyn_32464 [Prunus yedoensis var. nudiflora]
MMDFKGKKVGDMVVMAKEWLGWPLEYLQQPKEGRKVDTCNSQRMEDDGSRMTVIVAGMLAVAEER